MNSTNRIITNTAVLYCSLIVKMLLGFFTVRFVLKALGETDYGVYVIVAGVVAMLDILNSNMSNTSMRFLAHSLGSNDEEKILKTFNTTVVIHYIVGIVTILILEIGGFVMFEWFLNIPLDRLHAAHLIFQFMVITTFITIIAVPYDAVMNAHEHIYILSLFDILSGVILFLCAVFLTRCNGDRLIIYGLYLLFVQILLRILKVTFAKRHYSECRKVNCKLFDKGYFKSILSFTGWNLFGSIASLGAGQFRSLIVNNFFGVKLNASEGIASQASTPVNMVVTSMTRAINPQIMKSEGGGDHNRMLRIVEIGAKYSSFLFALLAIPVWLELPILLDIWLDVVPEYAIIFCRLLLISMLIEKFTFQITHAVRAVGIIRNFQVTESIACLIYLPFAYLAFRRGFPAETIYFLAIGTNVLTAFVRFYFGKKVAGIDIMSYIKNAILTVLIPIFVAGAVAYIFATLVPSTVYRIFMTFFMFWFVYFPLFIFLGMRSDERCKWISILKSLFCSIKNKRI